MKSEADIDRNEDPTLRFFCMLCDARASEMPKKILYSYLNHAKYIYELATLKGWRIKLQTLR